MSDKFETRQVKNTLYAFTDILELDGKTSTISVTDWAKGEGFDIFYQNSGQDMFLPVTWDAWQAIKKTVKRHNKIERE